MTALLVNQRSVVGVTPQGTLSGHLGGAVGVAAFGVRVALVEEGAPTQTLAHELSHVFSVDHVEQGDRAGGGRGRARERRGDAPRARTLEDQRLTELETLGRNGGHLVPPLEPVVDRMDELL